MLLFPTKAWAQDQIVKLQASRLDLPLQKCKVKNTKVLSALRTAGDVKLGRFL